MRLLGEHLEFDAVHLLKLLSALVGEVDPREVKILGKVLTIFLLTWANRLCLVNRLRKPFLTGD
jgi:hypothetical protein